MLAGGSKRSHNNGTANNGNKMNSNNGTANNGNKMNANIGRPIAKRPKPSNNINMVQFKKNINIGHPSGGGAFTNVTPPSGLAKFIGTKITNKYGGGDSVKKENIKKTHIFIKKVISEQSKYKNKVSSKDISNSNNIVTFDFKYYHDVLLFLVVIFVDYIHDLGDLDILS